MDNEPLCHGFIIQAIFINGIQRKTHHEDLNVTFSATRICIFNCSEQDVNDLLILRIISLLLFSFILSFLLCMHMARTFWDMSVARGVLRVFSVRIKLCLMWVTQFTTYVLI